MIKKFNIKDNTFIRYEVIGKKFEVDKASLKKNLQKETFIEEKTTKPFLKVSQKKSNVINIKNFKKRKKKNH